MRQSISRIQALSLKESAQVMRDPSSLIIAVILPLTLLFLFGYGVTFDPRFYKVGLIIEQPTPETGSFETALRSSRYFRVSKSRDLRTLEMKLVAGSIKGIVVLRSDFSRNAFAGNEAPIQVLVDGSDANSAELIQNYVRALSLSWLEQEYLKTGETFPERVRIEQRIWYNAEASSKNYLVPGSVAIIMTMIGTLLTSLVIVREWERGTMEALLTTPISASEFLIGKTIPYFVLGMISMGLSVGVAIFLFDVPFRGSIAMLTLTSSVFMWASLALGLFISTLASSQLVAAQVAILSAFLPAFYFSNFVFEIDSMPVPLQWVSYFVPAKYYVSSLQTLFLVGDVPRLIGQNTAILFVIAMLLFAATSVRTRMTLE